MRRELEQAAHTAPKSAKPGDRLRLRNSVESVQADRPAHSVERIEVRGRVVIVERRRVRA